MHQARGSRSAFGNAIYVGYKIRKLLRQLAAKNRTMRLSLLWTSAILNSTLFSELSVGVVMLGFKGSTDTRASIHWDTWSSPGPSRQYLLALCYLKAQMDTTYLERGLAVCQSIMQYSAWRKFRLDMIHVRYGGSHLSASSNLLHSRRPGSEKYSTAHWTWHI